MANTVSARKRARRAPVRARINRMRRTRCRTLLQAVEAAIADKNAVRSREAFHRAMPELHKAVGKGLLHKRTVARKLSRLSARLRVLP